MKLAELEAFKPASGAVVIDAKNVASPSSLEFKVFMLVLGNISSNCSLGFLSVDYCETRRTSCKG